MTTTAGDLIRTRREAAGLTLRRAASALGVSAKYLSDVEHGVTSLALARWVHLTKTIPGLGLGELARAHVDSGPVKIDARGLCENDKHVVADALVIAAGTRAKTEAA